AKIIVAVMMAMFVIMVAMIVMLMIVTMRMARAVIMIVAVTEQPRAEEVDGEPEAGHRYRLAIDDRNRRDQPQHALIGDLDRDDSEDQRTGEGGEIAELAGAEGEADIAGMAPREHVGGAGNSECCRVGAHVPAVGEQRHRAEDRARRDLGDHHDDGERYHEPGAALVARMLLAEEDVTMGPMIEGMGVHQRALRAANPVAII